MGHTRRGMQCISIWMIFRIIFLVQFTDAAPLLLRDVKADNVTIQQGVQLAVALAAMTLLFTAHRAVMNSGFTFSRKVLTTDSIIGLCLTSLSILWTSLVFLSGFVGGDAPCLNGLSPCLARAVFSPWILQVLSIFWMISWLDAMYFEDVRRISDRRRGLWNLDSSTGPFAWAESMNKKFLWFFYFCTFTVVFVTSYGAIREGTYTMGFLNIVGFVLFIGGAAGGKNKYCTAPHIYNGDMLRVALVTSHLEGTVYILPSKGYGFDAIWSPKIEFEHRELDLAMKDMDTARRTKDGGFKSKPFPIRSVLTPFTQRVSLTTAQLTELAEWLYLDPNSTKSQMRSIRCARAPGMHLIGSSLAFALCHAERLVFLVRHKLPEHLQNKLATLRNMKISGIGGLEDIHTVGVSPGGGGGGDIRKLCVTSIIYSVRRILILSHFILAALHLSGAVRSLLFLLLSKTMLRNCGICALRMLNRHSWLSIRSLSSGVLKSVL